MTHTSIDDQFAASLSGYLDLIEQQLLDAAVAKNPFTTEAARHVVAAGGKRFRPAMVVTTAHLGSGFDDERIINAALVMELTHAASLYHDDVMDEAQVRRGQPSANRAFGNSVAIMVGDFLFALASERVARLGTEYVDLQARTFAELVQGQIAETIGPAPDADRFEHYLDVVSGKTASLIRASALFGGMVAGLSPEHLDALAAYGQEIGMVFQLSDDLIDVISDETGKTPGTDLREGVATLPTLLLRRSDNLDDQQLVELIDSGLPSAEDLNEALTRLRANPVIDQARAYIHERAERARSYLAPLPDCPARDALSALCDEVVSRSS